MGDSSSVSSSATRSLKTRRAGKECRLTWHQTLGAYLPVLRSRCQPHRTFDSFKSWSQKGAWDSETDGTRPVILGEEVSLTTEPLTVGEGAAAEAGSSHENQDTFPEA